MNRLLAPIVLLTLTAFAPSAPAGSGYAERDDVRAFIAEMSERHGFDTEHLGETVDHVDSCRIHAALERTDIGPVDAGAMRQLLLGEALCATIRLEVVGEYLSDIHGREHKSL